MTIRPETAIRRTATAQEIAAAHAIYRPKTLKPVMAPDAVVFGATIL